MSDANNELIRDWIKGVRIGHIAHAKAAAEYHRRGRILGVVATVLMTLVGGGIAGGTDLGSLPVLEPLMAVATVLAAVLSGLQTFLDYPTLAARHREAAQCCGSLRRTMEEAVAIADGDGAALTASMPGYREQWESIERAAPTLHQRYYDDAERQAN